MDPLVITASHVFDPLNTLRDLIWAVVKGCPISMICSQGRSYQVAIDRIGGCVQQHASALSIGKCLKSHLRNARVRMAALEAANPASMMHFNKDCVGIM